MDEVSIIAIIIASISAGVAFMAFILNLKKSKTEKLVMESQFLRDFQTEYTQIELQFRNFRTKNDCIIFAWLIVNLMDRFCFFEQKGQVSKEMFTFFKNYLVGALSYYEWIIENKISDFKEYEKAWPYLEKTCKKHGIVSDKIILSVFRDISSKLH